MANQRPGRKPRPKPMQYLSRDLQGIFRALLDEINERIEAGRMSALIALRQSRMIRDETRQTVIDMCVNQLKYWEHCQACLKLLLSSLPKKWRFIAAMTDQDQYQLGVLQTQLFRCVPDQPVLNEQQTA